MVFPNSLPFLGQGNSLHPSFTQCADDVSDDDDHSFSSLKIASVSDDDLNSHSQFENIRLIRKQVLQENATMLYSPICEIALSSEALALRGYLKEQLPALIEKLNRPLGPVKDGYYDQESFELSLDHLLQQKPQFNLLSLQLALHVQEQCLDVSGRLFETHYSQIGWKGERKRMEDFSICFPCTILSSNQPTRAILMAVFDGHNGQRCAQFCKNKIEMFFGGNLEQPNSEPLELFLYNTLKERISLVQKLWLEEVQKCKNPSQPALFENQMMQHVGLDSGTTLNLVLTFQRGDTLEVWCANVGDSRTIALFYEGLQLHAIQLSQDQKPDSPELSQSIKKWGGTVKIDNQGTPRLDGKVAIGRFLGGASIVGVCPRPKITRTCFDTSKHSHIRIITATDGLWDLYGAKALQKIPMSLPPEEAVKIILNNVIQHQPSSNGGMDNTTVLCLDIKK